MRGDKSGVKVTVADATGDAAWGVDDRHWEDPDRRPVPDELMEKLRAKMARRDTVSA